MKDMGVNTPVFLLVAQLEDLWIILSSQTFPKNYSKRWKNGSKTKLQTSKTLLMQYVINRVRSQ